VIFTHTFPHFRKNSANPNHTHICVRFLRQDAWDAT
jgi:hypothetical protein